MPVSLASPVSTRPKPRRIANAKPLVWHVANVEDEATGEAFERFAFVKTDGSTGTLELPRASCLTHNEFRNRLLNANAALPLSRAEASRIVRDALIGQSKRQMRYMARTGWMPDGKGFVTPNAVIRRDEAAADLLPPRRSSSQCISTARVSGTLEAWQATVGNLSACSTTAMLAIAAALAAPLLPIKRLSSFGINAFFVSKAGKSLALLIAGSVIGLASEKELLNWLITQSALGEVSRFSNGGPLLLDEMNLLSDMRADALYAFLKQTSYVLSGGRDKQKNSRSQYAVSAIDAQFEIVFFSTSEKSIQEYAHLAGKTRDGGEFARFMDVAATSDGSDSIFDLMPLGMQPDQWKAWKEKAIEDAKKEVAKNTGTPMQAYIRYIVDLGDHLPSVVDHYFDYVLARLRSDDMNAVTLHMARNFALLGAGAYIAHDAGILRWDREDLQAMIERAFERTLKPIETPSAADLVSEGIALLWGALKSARLPLRTSFNKERDSDGFYERSDNRNVFTVRAKTLRVWFRLRPELLEPTLDYLMIRELLTPNRGTKKASLARAAERAETSPRWPSGDPVRSFVFSMPLPAAVTRPG